MRNVLEWLEESAQRLPEKVAFAGVDSRLTFSELEQFSRRAGSFFAKRVPARTPIAFYLEKSPEAMAGMFGAVYARCPYSVIDVRQPSERARAVVGKLEPGLVVADAANLERAEGFFAPMGMSVVALDALFDEPIDESALERLRAEFLDIDLLYINFTSGSTGIPKGVAVRHRSVIDFIPHFTRIFGIDEEDRIGNQAPFDFDVSVKDIYGGISTGATVHLIPRDYFSTPADLMDFLVERRITVCTWAVSAMCFVSGMNGFEYKVPHDVAKVIFSGEVMPPKQLAKWQRALPDARFYNVYGPTEITCNCTWFAVKRPYGKDEIIPIGRAFPNEHVFLLDEDDREVVGAGEQGEVCVVGTALAAGYYNDPSRTDAAFVQNPLNPHVPELMYRTGDIGQWDAQGDLVYLGRKDHQVKHMGQRIELGEIESAAQGADGVSRACCLYDSRRKRILLFYAGGADKSWLFDYLRGRVPQYMVPNKMFSLDAMPLTKNGKVDRVALAEMGGIR